MSAFVQSTPLVDLPGIGLDGLCANWSIQNIQVCVKNSGHLAAQAETLQRIRGAMGREMYASASKSAQDNRPCTFTPTCAYDLFHRVQGKLPNKRSIPMPYVIECDPIGQDLLVTVRLFGRAVYWVHEFRAALVAGLRKGLIDNSGRLHPQTISASQIVETTGVHIHNLDAPIVIDFLTPVLQSRNGVPIFEPLSLLTGLAARIAGMAWWHNSTLLLDAFSVDAAARRLLAGAQSYTDEAKFLRGHGNQNRATVQTGTTGWLRCPAPTSPLSIILQLGVQTHFGAKTSAGAGRYLLKLE